MKGHQAMNHYTPGKLRRWTLPAMALRALAYVLKHWFVFLIAAVLISPVGPHIRIQYTYVPGWADHKTMLDCRYFGPRGMVRKTFGTDCPFFAVIDTRKTP